MSIRRTIESLLEDEQQQEAFRASPESYFADHGIEDIPGELLGSAFVHYSDTAPIEHGDAVAGIATHYSAVPFESADLPGFALEDGDSPFDTLGSLTETAPSDLPDADPIEHDDGADQALGPDDDSPADDSPADDDSHDDDSPDGSATDDTPNEHDSGVAETESDADNGADHDAESAGANDDIDIDSFNDNDFDNDFDDGFEAAEALEHDLDAGFGDGVVSNGPTEILGEIHGGGPMDPEIDDPFFDAVTDDGMPSVQVELEIIDFEQTGLEQELGQDLGDEMGHDAFTEHVVEEFDDVDPSDLDIDDF